MLRLGEWVWERRTRESLEQGGDPPKGAHSPRVRRSPARGGAWPSSEVEFRPRGRPALERGGVSTVRRCPLERSGLSPEGCRGPRLLSPGRDCVGCNLQFVSLFVFRYLRKKMGFPPGY
jgi:hypothetical protein